MVIISIYVYKALWISEIHTFVSVSGLLERGSPITVQMSSFRKSRRSHIRTITEQDLFVPRLRWFCFNALKKKKRRHVPSRVDVTHVVVSSKQYG